MWSVRLYVALHISCRRDQRGCGGAERRGAHFEVLGDVVHLLPLEVGDDDVYVVASHIVHAAEEHELRQLTRVHEELEVFLEEGRAPW
jgi:hypothetical protein